MEIEDPNFCFGNIHFTIHSYAYDENLHRMLIVVHWQKRTILIKSNGKNYICENWLPIELY